MTITSLRALGIGVDIGPVTVLDEIRVEARAGEVLGLAGPSGSGKTTLLHVLARLVAPTRGHIAFDGGGPGPPDVAVVLQNSGLAPTLTAIENVALPLLATGRYGPTVARQCARAIELVGLADVADQLVGELSGGQRQRVAIARVVVRQADVVLADEPTAALDDAWRATVLDILTEEATRGAVLVIASHDPVVLGVCTHVVDLVGGRAAAVG